MSEDVKPRRRYDSRRRQAQAAGVVVETIYRGFGGKAGLFKAVLEAAVAGGIARAQVPVEQRPAIRAMIDETDPRRQLEGYAATQPGIHARVGPLTRVLAGAAATDPELANVLREMEDFRLAGMGRFAQLLADRGALRADLSVEHARDILWALASHTTYDQLVTQRGWSPEQYQTWL